MRLNSKLMCAIIKQMGLRAKHSYNMSLIPMSKGKYFNSFSFSIEQNHFRNHDVPRSPKEAAGECSQVSFCPSGTQQVAPNSQDGDKNVKKQPSAGFVEGSSSQCYTADSTNFLPEKTQRGKTDEDGYVALRKDNSSSGRGNFLTSQSSRMYYLAHQASGSSTEMSSPTFWLLGNLIDETTNNI